MAKKTKTKNKNVIVYIIITLLLIVTAVGIVFACTSILKIQKDYLVFVVSDTQSKDIIKSSTNNALTFDTTYTFDIKYIFAEENNNNKNYDFAVNVTGCQNLPLYKGEYPVQFNKLDLSNEFKLEKKDMQFTITIPPAEEFFEIVFSEYVDVHKNEIYVFDLCEIDYFSLNIISYNGKDNINYKFHLINKENETFGIKEILTSDNELYFNSNETIYFPVQDIEISDNEIVFDGTEVNND